MNTKILAMNGKPVEWSEWFTDKLFNDGFNDDGSTYQVICVYSDYDGSNETYRRFMAQELPELLKKERVKFEIMYGGYNTHWYMVRTHNKDGKPLKAQTMIDEYGGINDMLSDLLQGDAYWMIEEEILHENYKDEVDAINRRFGLEISMDAFYKAWGSYTYESEKIADAFYDGSRDENDLFNPYELEDTYRHECFVSYGAVMAVLIEKGLLIIENDDE